MTPTIVLLPGLLCDAAVWQGVRPALEALAPVRIGDFSEGSSIGGWARAVLENVEGPLILIGHSMGGRVALEIAAQAPERVVALGLLDTGIHPRRESEVEKRAALVKLAYEKGMAALADAWLPPMVEPRRRSDAALLAPMRAMVERSTPERHERQIQALLDRPDAANGLSALSCPTLVMVGRHDEWSPVAQHEEIVALIPGARLVVIEDSGHMLPMEQPERTAEALAEWIRGSAITA